MPDAQRHCATCGDPLPLGSKRGRLYCGYECRTAGGQESRERYENSVRGGSPDERFASAMAGRRFTDDRNAAAGVS